MVNRLISRLKELLTKKKTEVKPKCYTRKISRSLNLGGKGR